MGNGLLLAGRTFGGGIEPLLIAVVGTAVVATVGTVDTACTAGTAGMTAGDCDTAFSSLTGSAGERAGTALGGRTSAGGSTVAGT